MGRRARVCSQSESALIRIGAVLLIEIFAKEIYQAVKSRQILLPTAKDFVPSTARNPQLRSLSDYSGSDRTSAYKRGSIRGMSGLAPGSSGAHDGRASPTPSNVTSIGEVSPQILMKRSPIVSLTDDLADLPL